MTTTSKFTEVRTEEIPDVIFFKCARCGVVVEESEKESHQCPNPRADDEKRLQELLDSLTDESIPVKQRIANYDLYERGVQALLEDDIKSIEAKYGKFYRQVIVEGFDRKFEMTQKYRDRIFEEYDNMRKRGIPFIERKKFLDEKQSRLKYCDDEEKAIQDHKRRFIPIPLKDWMDELDVERMKKRGFRYVIMDAVYWGRCYWLKK